MSLPRLSEHFTSGTALLWSAVFAAVCAATPRTAWPQSDSALDAAKRQTVVERLATRLEAVYVTPAVATTLARQVRDRLHSHAYDSLSNPRAFADALSRDLASIAQDLHLWVRYFAPPSGPAMPDLDETWLNHGFPDVRILDGNVGYIVIRSFTPGSDAERASSAAFSLLKDADALIIDVRNNGGGTTPFMARIASYFFADSAYLGDLHWRDMGDTVRIWTQPGAVGPNRLSRQPAWLLTSRRTFSAGETFAYSLQALHRAVIVGDVTRGGAHTAKGPLQDLGFGIRALIPGGEILHPVTKASWERVGVQPDIVTPDSLALRTAHRAALAELIKGAAPGPRRDRLARALEALK